MAAERTAVADGPGVSAQQVLRTRLPVTAIGRRGLQEQPVLALLQRAAGALTTAELEIGELQAEVDRLNTYIRQQWHDDQAPGAGHSGHGATGGSASPGPGVTQALEVMARAQQVAGERLAEAERAEQRSQRRAAAVEQRAQAVREQAGRVLEEAERGAATALEHAREQYEQIITRAHRRAEQAAESAMQEFLDCPPDQPGLREQLQARATYLRGTAQVSATTLRAALESTRQAFDRLVMERFRPDSATPGPPGMVISAAGQVTTVHNRPAALSAR